MVSYLLIIIHSPDQNTYHYNNILLKYLVRDKNVSIVVVNTLHGPSQGHVR